MLCVLIVRQKLLALLEKIFIHEVDEERAQETLSVVRVLENLIICRSLVVFYHSQSSKHQYFRKIRAQQFEQLVEIIPNFFVIHVEDLPQIYDEAHFV